MQNSWKRYFNSDTENALKHILACMHNRMDDGNKPYTSIYAEFIAPCAASTAVSNPKVLSINNMSLSMVFGTPTTDTLSLRLRHYNQEFKI